MVHMSYVPRETLQHRIIPDISPRRIDGHWVRD